MSASVTSIRPVSIAPLEAVKFLPNEVAKQAVLEPEIYGEQLLRGFTDVHLVNLDKKGFDGGSAVFVGVQRGENFEGRAQVMVKYPGRFKTAVSKLVRREAQAIVNQYVDYEARSEDLL